MRIYQLYSTPSQTCSLLGKPCVPWKTNKKRSYKRQKSSEQKSETKSADPGLQDPQEIPTGDVPIEEAESKGYRTVSEGVAIETIKLAASHGNAQTTKLLLIQRDQNPLPSQYCLLNDAAQYGHAESVDILINHGADPKETTSTTFAPPLFTSWKLRI